MTVQDIRDFLKEEFDSHQSFSRWRLPITWEDLTLMNETPSNYEHYMRRIKIVWKGDYVSHIDLDHDIRKWSDGRRHLAFRIYKELEKFNG